MNFDGVWNLISSTIPPEISHYQYGHHPGLGWWLKTVVPQNDPIGLLKIWIAITDHHPGLVLISDQAYDWYGQTIQNCCSIWIKENTDIDLAVCDNNIKYVIYPFDDATNRWGNRLRTKLVAYGKNKSDNFDKDNWHKLLEIASLLKQWTTNRQAQVKRKSWKIVRNEQTNQSQSNN